MAGPTGGALCCGAARGARTVLASTTTQAITIDTNPTSNPMRTPKSLTGDDPPARGVSVGPVIDGTGAVVDAGRLSGAPQAGQKR